MAASAIVEMGPANARADSSETELREAKLRFDEGIGRVQAGDLEGARRSFQQSLAVTPTQSAMFNLALVEERTGRTLEALAHFRQYTQRYALAGEERGQVQKHVTDLSEKTGHIDVQAPYGTVLSLDGVANAGTTPLAEPLDVAPGRHVIEAKLPQGSKLQAVDALAGQVARVSFGDEGVSSGPIPGLAPEDGGDARAAGATSSQGAERLAPPASTATRTRILTVAAIGGAAVASGLVALYLGLQSNQDAKTFKELKNDRTRRLHTAVGRAQRSQYGACLVGRVARHGRGAGGGRGRNLVLLAQGHVIRRAAGPDCRTERDRCRRCRDVLIRPASSRALCDERAQDFHRAGVLQQLVVPDAGPLDVAGARAEAGRDERRRVDGERAIGLAAEHENGRGDAIQLRQRLVSMQSGPGTPGPHVDLRERGEERRGRERLRACARRDCGRDARPQRESDDVDASAAHALDLGQICGGSPAVLRERRRVGCASAAVEAAVRPHGRSPAAIRDERVQESLRFGQERPAVAREVEDPRRLGRGRRPLEASQRHAAIHIERLRMPRPA
jgi:hypothetical protein